MKLLRRKEDKDIKIKYADPQLKINTKTQKQAKMRKIWKIISTEKLGSSGIGIPDLDLLR